MSTRFLISIIIVVILVIIVAISTSRAPVIVSPVPTPAIETVYIQQSCPTPQAAQEAEMLYDALGSLVLGGQYQVIVIEGVEFKMACHKRQHFLEDNVMKLHGCEVEVNAEMLYEKFNIYLPVIKK
jgi:hypothetical protein